MFYLKWDLVSVSAGEATRTTVKRKPGGTQWVRLFQDLLQKPRHTGIENLPDHPSWNYFFLLGIDGAGLRRSFGTSVFIYSFIPKYFLNTLCSVSCRVRREWARFEEWAGSREDVRMRRERRLIPNIGAFLSTDFGVHYDTPDY